MAAKIYFLINDKDKLDNILTLINTYGYFVSDYKVLLNNKIGNAIDYETYLNKDAILNFNEIKELWLSIEPKFDYVDNNTNIKFLYHVSDKKYKTNYFKNYFNILK